MRSKFYYHIEHPALYAVRLTIELCYILRLFNLFAQTDLVA